MAATIAGLSTLGVKFGYAVETVAGQKPLSFTQLERCNSIAGISLSAEQIDASALEDYVSRYVAGRQDTGGTWSVTFNTTPEVVAQLEEMIEAYNEGKAETTPLRTWFEVWAPDNDKAFFVVAQPPQKLPMPEFAQNALQTIEITFTIEEYKGQDTAIQPIAQGVELDEHAVAIAEGDTETLRATTWPSGGTVTWSSSKPTVATVSSGIVTGESSGKATISASYSYNGFTYVDKCEVIVT